MKSVVRVLDHNDAAAERHSGGPSGPIVQAARQDHTDHSAPVPAGGAAEQWVHGRAVLVLLGSVTEHDRVLQDEQMLVRWRDGQVTEDQRLRVRGVTCCERSSPGKDLWKRTANACRLVQDDEHRGWQLFGQVRDEDPQRLHTSGGRAQYDHHTVITHDDTSRGSCCVTAGRGHARSSHGTPPRPASRRASTAEALAFTPSRAIRILSRLLSRPRRQGPAAGREQGDLTPKHAQLSAWTPSISVAGAHPLALRVVGARGVVRIRGDRHRGFLRRSYRAMKVEAEKTTAT